MKEKKIRIKKISKYGTNIFKVNGEFRFIPLMFNILLPVVLGGIVGYINSNTIEAYNSLNKFFLTPPPLVFKIVWPILYGLMGLSAYRIYMRNKQGVKDNGAYFYYLIQLIVNLIWPFIFFTLRLYGISFIVIIILIILVSITIHKFYKTDKLAAGLMIPYFLWIVFASTLNFFIYTLNEM